MSDPDSIEATNFLSTQLWKLCEEKSEMQISGDVKGALEVLAGVAMLLEKRANSAAEVQRSLDIELLLRNTTEKMVENMRKDLLALEAENTRALSMLDRLGYEQDEFGEWLLCQHPKNGMHGDDEALKAFAGMMSARLKYKREGEGRSGWQLMDGIELHDRLSLCVDEERWVDAANYAMFLHMNRLRATAKPAMIEAGQSNEPRDGGWHE